MRKILYLLGILSVFYIQNSKSQTIDTLVDSRDGVVYHTVKVGNQVWMAENLKYNSVNSWCYENKPENGDIFGRLYTWNAANTACPTGWHLPSDIEWQTLEKYLGMAESDLAKANEWRGTDQGKRLISDQNLGFKLIMGGFRNPPSNYNLLKSQAFLWTSTEFNGSAWFRQIYEGNSQILRLTRPLNCAFSVRCIKN